MSNFAFLHSTWPQLEAEARKVEQFALSEARTACMYARRVVEGVAEWLYANDAAFKRPYDDSLSALIHEPSFQSNVPTDIWQKIQLVRKVGNLAVHNPRPVSQYDALQSTKETWHILYWLARTYERGGAEKFKGLTFDQSLLPTSTGRASADTQKQVLELDQKLREKDEELEKKSARIRFADTLIEDRDKKIGEQEAQILKLLAEIAATKEANAHVRDTHDYNEAETRDLFIDLLLRESGWIADSHMSREYPVSGLPKMDGNTTGAGAVDYVLWSTNGKPLAVVEAKRTKVDPRAGREQARQYADALEANFGQRPLIFYTNGYETWLWDDANYPPRGVAGFYTSDELELRIQRRASAGKLSDVQVNAEIVERYYQEESIRAVTEQFEKQRRKALIVMATGAGKTRTAIALVELLQRAGWAKRILFLADRRALVKQAANAFKAHLPNSATVNLLVSREDTDARVFCSTYPTIMNMIDEMDEKDVRRFGPGFFDLVIVDEAHRSIYQKYREIFQYFDSLLIGLTATPKDEVDINTYTLFDLESGVPTYAYELDQAIADGYLVPYKAKVSTTTLLREGIKYKQLSEADRDKFESVDWGDGTGEIPESIESSAINKWLFNEATVDEVLKDLMENGIKVEGGDKLGKTILFAANHNHAVYIEERFNLNYPHHKGMFARVIDNQETRSESLIDSFSKVRDMPQIAISVDMLDTGIDIPEVVNLVFFKAVRSRTKFHQMIGRGTRLCKDLFGPGDDKKQFLIFDYGGNFDFFDAHPAGMEGGNQESISERIFKFRLELLDQLTKPAAKDDSLESLRHSIKGTLHGEVAAMNVNNFIVRKERKLVEKFKDRERWDTLTKEDYSDLAKHLAGLPNALPSEDESAKRFDILLLQLELGILNSEPKVDRLISVVKEIASDLEAIRTIPQIEHVLPLIQDVQTDEYWENITLPMLDDTRLHLRNLIRFIEKARRKIVYTDFADVRSDVREFHHSSIASTSAFDLQQYRKKVEQFLRAHENHPAITRLRLNFPITKKDLTDLERLLYEAGGIPDKRTLDLLVEQRTLGEFIRSLVGLDREAAKKAFGNFLNDKVFNSTQIRFVNQIIDYLTQNGMMKPELLFDAPFTQASPDGISGVFSDGQAIQIVALLDSIHKNALGGARAN
jgi:type I restriction enzyme R subunit